MDIILLRQNSLDCDGVNLLFKKGDAICIALFNIIRESMM